MRLQLTGNHTQKDLYGKRRAHAGLSRSRRAHEQKARIPFTSIRAFTLLPQLVSHVRTDFPCVTLSLAYFHPDQVFNTMLFQVSRVSYTLLRFGQPTTKPLTPFAVIKRSHCCCLPYSSLYRSFRNVGYSLLSPLLLSLP